MRAGPWLRCQDPAQIAQSPPERLAPKTLPMSEMGSYKTTDTATCNEIAISLNNSNISLKEKYCSEIQCSRS